jgi:hypothetical protein
VNVVIPAGSQLQLALPGFTSAIELMTVTPPHYQLSNEFYVSSVNSVARWDQLQETLSLDVPRFQKIPRSKLNLLLITDANGGFRLPKAGLLLNDPRLTLAVTRNQIIRPRPFQESPRVVDRSFDISEFEYLPPQKESTFMLRMRLRPTVNITKDQPIVVALPGFINVLSKYNIHITGAHRSMIRDSMAQWNATTSELTMLAPLESNIEANSLLHLQIEESQGFILPASLNANDTRITVSSINNIMPPEPVKMSPMVGNGPNAGHRFCMYQHERGTRTTQPICTAAATCNPPLTDPCSQEELERCGCSLASQEIWPLQIRGFNLQPEDKISFLPEEQLCGTKQSGVLSSFGLPVNVTLNDDLSLQAFNGISSRDTGYFRICINHVGKVFDVGLVTVRPSCRKPLVMVDGVCVEHCPKTKIPIAGACLRDPIAGEDWDKQALMLAVRIDDETVANSAMADSPSNDPERRYFIYRYTYELARLLNCDPGRIKIASLSNGSLIANTVFTTVGGDEAVKVTTGERSPMGLISLLRALQRDSSSQLYESSFFKYIDRSYRPEPFYVRKCSDDVYRIFCPYTGEIISHSLGFFIFGVGTLVTPLFFACICFAAWQVDRDSDQAISDEIIEQIKRDPRLVKPPMQVEYARSWLEGRFMGEEWQSARNRKLLSIGNGNGPKSKTA